MRKFLQILGKRPKKKRKGFHLKKCTDFHEFWDQTTKKKRIFLAKSAKEQFLLSNSGVITSILGVSGLKLHSSDTEPVTFFGTQLSLEGTQFSFGGAQVVI